VISLDKGRAAWYQSKAVLGAARCRVNGKFFTVASLFVSAAPLGAQRSIDTTLSCAAEKSAVTDRSTIYPESESNV